MQFNDSKKEGNGHGTYAEERKACGEYVNWLATWQGR